MGEPSSNTQEKSQYHHFIPRFILRNYSHLGQRPAASRGSKNRRKGRNAARSKEPMLFGLNFAGEEPEIIETSVAKTFGMMDMYRDFRASTRQHQVEEQLSVLESRAGEIISTIRKAFEAGKTDVWITRTQRDTLRKFLFIMKYRGSRFHKRYCHENTDDYDENDKEKMVEYMEKNDIKKPVDVWLDNIRGILDLKMDGQEWMDILRKRIYPDDAEWFINNVQGFYMALMTPFNQEDEFLLTENAYSIHEGAASERFNPITGKMELSAYTEFHLFAPIAPRLLIVLRSSLLPVPEEDSDPTIRVQRKLLYEASLASYHRPEAAGLLLRDLPINKARNSYSKIVDGRSVLISKGPIGANDRFGFTFFPIPEEYVFKINDIMLEESHRIDLIIFNNNAAAFKSLSHYLNSRAEFDTDTRRVANIRRLRRSAQLLATALPAQVTFSLQETMPPVKESSGDKVYLLFTKDSKAKQLYFELSGKSLDHSDFDQARELLFMRIKLDSTTRYLPQDIRANARNKFLEQYERIPVQVVWIYLKRIRFMKLGGTMINVQNVLEDNQLPAQQLHGAEDVIVASREVFRKKDFCRLMHHASLNAFLVAKPLWGLINELTLDDNGMKRLHEEKELVLGDQGSICDCGIPKVEEAARAIREAVKASREHMREFPLDHIFSDDEKIELLTRDLLRDYNAKDSGKGLIEDNELERVLFDIIYPLFGSRQRPRQAGNVGNEEQVDEALGCLVQ
ncbi:hypothetical protein BGZ60DRAFT_422302 [Tricladium varicosporioides]|nr:hypothetical protein BGZ60DRAFT_422302 [Hymenoscyphus varicosporioides]